jgi:hypothetical protein
MQHMMEIVITDLLQQSRSFEIDTAIALQYIFIITVYNTKKTPAKNL